MDYRAEKKKQAQRERNAFLKQMFAVGLTEITRLMSVYKTMTLSHIEQEFEELGIAESILYRMINRGVIVETSKTNVYRLKHDV